MVPTMESRGNEHRVQPPTESGPSVEHGSDVEVPYQVRWLRSLGFRAKETASASRLACGPSMMTCISVL